MNYLTDFFLYGHSPYLGLGFVLLIVLFLVFDLGFLHRKDEVTTFRSSLLQTIFWIAVSVIYGFLILFVDKAEADPMSSSRDFFTAYVLEKSLSMDNIFVILLILKYFKIEEKFYHKILFWGILGAVVLRALFIFTGSVIVEKFHWILYLFGLFLVYSGAKIFFNKGDTEVNPDRNFLYRLLRKHAHLTTEQQTGRFFFKSGGTLWITPLLVALVLVESTDLIFAVDSIPAAFAVTTDRFIIYTSNICAVMGLRAMFFLISSILDKFYLLEKALAVVLVFIGAKMLLDVLEYVDVYIEVPNSWSFGIVLGTLLGSMLLSLVIKPSVSSPPSPPSPSAKASPSSSSAKA